jgi:hypothetical protein
VFKQCIKPDICPTHILKVCHQRMQCPGMRTHSVQNHLAHPAEAAQCARTSHPSCMARPETRSPNFCAKLVIRSEPASACGLSNAGSSITGWRQSFDCFVCLYLGEVSMRILGVQSIRDNGSHGMQQTLVGICCFICGGAGLKGMGVYASMHGRRWVMLSA